jgi:hypothetical protein
VNHRRILTWAERHIEAVEASSSKFLLEHEPYRLRHDVDSTFPNYVLRLAVKPGVTFPDEWVFMIGDAIHNMRVALDYLTFAIVTKHDPSTPITQILFPIYHTPKQYAKQEGRRLGNIDPAIKKVFEDFQPYHRQHAPKSEPLGALDWLENVHKHRHLLDAGVAISDFAYTLKGRNPADVRIRSTSIWDIAHSDGAELAQYTLPDRATKVEFRAQFHICFSKTDPNRAKGHVVVRLLKRIRDHIRDGIFPRLEPFL